MRVRKNSSGGISLLELLIVMAVASIMFTALLIALQQALSAQQRGANIASQQMRASLVAVQLAQDFAGVLVPVLVEEVSTGTKKVETPAPIPASKEKTEEQKEKDEKIIFYAAASKDNLEMLSFITNNSIPAITATDKALPRVARVVYRLVADKNHEGSYNLYRQEVTDLSVSFRDEKSDALPATAYELVGGIAQITATFGFIISAKEEKKGEKKAAKEIKTVQVWKQGDKEKLPTLPHFITLNLTLWDKTYRRKEMIQLRFELLKNSDPKTQAAKVAPPAPKPQAPVTKPTVSPQVRSPFRSRPTQTAHLGSLTQQPRRQSPLMRLGQRVTQ